MVVEAVVTGVRKINLTGSFIWVTHCFRVLGTYWFQTVKKNHKLDIGFLCYKEPDFNNTRLSWLFRSIMFVLMGWHGLMHYRKYRAMVRSDTSSLCNAKNNNNQNTQKPIEDIALFWHIHLVAAISNKLFSYFIISTAYDNCSHQHKLDFIWELPAYTGVSYWKLFT